MEQPAKHFLELTDYTADELRDIISLARALKKTNGMHEPFLERKSLAAIFDKRSLRTRNSFAVGMTQLGGSTEVLLQDDIKMGEKESVAHTAGTLSRYFTAIAIRISSPETLREFASHSTVPVINAMTNDSHPCQIMADLQTIAEHKGSFEGKKIVWLGDYNNISKTYVQAATIFPDIELVLAVPQQHLPAQLPALPANIRFEQDPLKAAKGADVVVTDVWVSMGQSEKDEAVFKPYQVNKAIMDAAAPGAIFMHCMPVKTGKEVTQEVLDMPNSVIFDEAENRMHVQKAILLTCLGQTKRARASLATTFLP